jgi:hypothetical protein
MTGRLPSPGTRRFWGTFAGALYVSGAQPLGGGGAQVPGVGGDHERPARVERQPVQGEPVYGGSGL